MNSTDGRDTRWAEHRRTRRGELVEAALRAIRRHGEGVGMDEIAAEAGTSKTVLYRHFTDKAGLYVAVAASVDRLILRELAGALAGPDVGAPASRSNAGRAASTVPATGTPRELIAAAVDAYLALVEADPEVYRFVVAHPMLDRPVRDDPVTGLTSRIGDELARLLDAALRAGGRDPSAAGPWGHGVVGLVRAGADHWLRCEQRQPRERLVQHLSALIWGGLEPALAPREER